MKMISFKELAREDADSSLYDARGGLPSDYVSKVLNYLRAGTVLAVSAEISCDVFSNNNAIIGTLEIYTDGEWGWYSDLIYYVENYHVALPSLFLDKIGCYN
ncbi:hypothetical protein ACNENL_001402 [Escherichia fergusonii]